MKNEEIKLDSNKIKYFFLLGRNPILSEAEILSCFEKEGIKWKSHKLKLNALLIETDKELNLKKMINSLGGTIAIGKVILFGDKEKTLNQIENKKIYFGRENKLIYSVLNYMDGEENFNSILEAIENNFKKENLKSRYKGVSGTIRLQNGKIVKGSPEKISQRDMTYFAFSDGKEWNFGFLEESYDSAEAEKRDMKKPYRREELAISPRLARIMINLSQAKEGETLLDAFCGIGVILVEALAQGVNVIGIDIDNNAIKKTRANILWLRKNYKINSTDKVIAGDSRKAIIDRFDAMVSEPQLGELMTKMPNEEKARQVVNQFENLIISVLNNVKKYIKRGGKIVFSAPLIKTQKGRIGCNAEKIETSTGLKLYVIKDSCIKFPIKEYRDEQIVGREIYVLNGD